MSANWQSILAQAVRQPLELLRQLELQDSPLAAELDAHSQFPMLVPQPFIERMRKGDPADPLLRQVLPLGAESLPASGFSLDPLSEQAANVLPGLIHKYHGRVLLLAATGCAVNCRYCFRRHFPYADNRVGRKQWQPALNYIAADSSISEVILSGGDPLLLSDAQLGELLEQVASIEHVQRLRIHSRLPVVIPQRLTDGLRDVLAGTRLQCSLVLHVNHGRELSDLHLSALAQLRASGVCLLNQSVLLAGVNDSVEVLRALSERLFAFGVLPYYLHLLDAVLGAQHFAVSQERALAIYRQLHGCLPGYLLPRLARELAGEPGKTLLT